MAHRHPVPHAIQLRFVQRASRYVRTDPLRLIVEGGGGTPHANSYASLSYANDYFVGRRLYSSAWTAALDDVKIVALKEASMVLDAEFYWTGAAQLNPAQGLGWPRTKAYDRYRNAITGVPKQVRDATCELALYLLAQDRLVARDGVGISSLRVDVIAIVFDKSQSPQTFPDHVARLLNGLGVPLRNGQVRNVKLFRAG